MYNLPRRKDLNNSCECPCARLQELQEKLDLQHRDRKRAIAKLNKVSPSSFAIGM